MIKTKNRHILNNLYRWAMSKKLPVNHFTWAENISEFNGNFTKSYMIVNIPKIYVTFTIISPFCLQE